MEFNIQQLKWQKEYYKNRKRFNALALSRSCGKTRNNMISVLLDCLQFPHIVEPSKRPVVLVLAEDSVLLTQIFWNPFVEWITNSELSKITEIHKQEKRIRFNFGNKVLPDILCRGLGTDTSGDNLRGLSYYRVYIDECQDIVKLDTVINEIINPRLDYPDSCLTIVGTPKGRGSLFHKLYETADFKLNLDAYSNPFNSVDKLQRLKETLPPKAYNQEILAKWETFAGQIFANFNEDVNIYKQSNPPNINKDAIYFGYDFGSVNNAIVVLGLDNDLNLYVLDSYYNDTGNPLTVSELMNKTKQLISGGGYPYRFILPDDRKDIAISLKDEGYAPTRIITVVRNSDFIRPDHRYSITDSLFYNKRLFVNENQQNLINEISSFRRDDKYNIAKGQKDHRVDALTYIVGYLYKTSKRIRQKTPVILNIQSNVVDLSA